MGLTSFPLSGQPDEKRSSLDIYRCFFEDCLPPEPPSYPTNRPDEVLLWSDDATWTALNVPKYVNISDLQFKKTASFLIKNALGLLMEMTLSCQKMPT